MQLVIYFFFIFIHCNVLGRIDSGCIHHTFEEYYIQNRKFFRNNVLKGSTLLSFHDVPKVVLKHFYIMLHSHNRSLRISKELTVTTITTNNSTITATTATLSCSIRFPNKTFNVVTNRTADQGRHEFVIQIFGRLDERLLDIGEIPIVHDHDILRDLVIRQLFFPLPAE